MSDSYPTIQESLSEIQMEFMGCVEMHLDPPETDDANYSIDALYRCNDPQSPLPGNAVRFAISIEESAGNDVSERRHEIEFVEGGELVGHIRHSLKRIEAGSGTYFWTESHFEVDAPDVPHRRTQQSEVEVEVETYLERLRALDRVRSLVQVS